jgi:hypothetical protein
MYKKYIMYNSEDFLKVFYDSVSTCFAVVIDCFITYSVKIVEYLKNVDYYALGIRALVFYSNVSSQTYKFSKKLYRNYPLVKDTVDRAIYVKATALAFVQGYKLEPYDQNWMCTASLTNNKSPLYADDPCQYTDTYDIIFDTDDQHYIIREFKHSSNTLNDLLKESTNICEFMVTLKYNSSYVYRVINKDYKDEDIVLPAVASNVKLISIEYTNPSQQQSIFIDLDKSIYMVGNEILSPIFIKRYLSYQSLSFHFDYDYVVNIIDGDLNTITLKSNQHILLHADKYEIIET